MALLAILVAGLVSAAADQVVDELGSRSQTLRLRHRISSQDHGVADQSKLMNKYMKQPWAGPASYGQFIMGYSDSHSRLAQQSGEMRKGLAFASSAEDVRWKNNMKALPLEDIESLEKSDKDIAENEVYFLAPRKAGENTTKDKLTAAGNAPIGLSMVFLASFATMFGVGLRRLSQSLFSSRSRDTTDSGWISRISVDADLYERRLWELAKEPALAGTEPEERASQGVVNSVQEMRELAKSDQIPQFGSVQTSAVTVQDETWTCRSPVKDERQLWELAKEPALLGTEPKERASQGVVNNVLGLVNSEGSPEKSPTPQGGSSSPMEIAIASGDPETVVTVLEDFSVECDRRLAAAGLDCVAEVGQTASNGDSGSSQPSQYLEYQPGQGALGGGAAAFAMASEEKRLVRYYEALKQRGLASKFGVGIEAPWPVRRGGVTEEYIAAKTGLSLEAFRPKGGAQIQFGAIGAVACVAEVMLSKALGFESPQPLFLASAGLVAADQLALRGAVAETVVSAFNPSYADRIVRHEAGHVLLGYLLGCPVQGCVLSAREAMSSGGSGAAALNGAAGTAFFDPELNMAVQEGRISRGVLDRYCVVVMGGIAAEAISFGNSEGGRDDESALIRFLSQEVGFANQDNPGDILNQARWAVLNAVCLLRQYREEYENLVEVLAKTRASSIGTVMLSIEGNI